MQEWICNRRNISSVWRWPWGMGEDIRQGFRMCPTWSLGKDRDGKREGEPGASISSGVDDTGAGKGGEGLDPAGTSQGIRAIKGCYWVLVWPPARGMQGIWIPTSSTWGHHKNHESATGSTAKSTRPTEIHIGFRRGIRTSCAQPNATAGRAGARPSAFFW